MAIIILGNGGNLSVSEDNSDGDTIILGNGANDAVSADSSQTTQSSSAMAMVFPCLATIAPETRSSLATAPMT